MGIAGCSGELSRFKENPFSSKNSPEATGSIQPAPVAPASQVESRPLPPHAQLPPSPPTPSARVHSSGVAGGGKRPGLVHAGHISGESIFRAFRHVERVRSDWRNSATQGGPDQQLEVGWWHCHNGGRQVTPSTASARRYGVPAAAIIQANNLSAPATHPCRPATRHPALSGDARAPASPPKLSPVAATSSAATGTPAGFRACMWSRQGRL